MKRSWIILRTMNTLMYLPFSLQKLWAIPPRKIFADGEHNIIRCSQAISLPLISWDITNLNNWSILNVHIPQLARCWQGQGWIRAGPRPNRPSRFWIRLWPDSKDFRLDLEINIEHICFWEWVRETIDWPNPSPSPVQVQARIRSKLEPKFRYK